MTKLQKTWIQNVYNVHQVVFELVDLEYQVVDALVDPLVDPLLDPLVDPLVHLLVDPSGGAQL